MKRLKYKYDNCPDVLNENYEIINGNVELFRLAKNKKCEEKNFLPHCKIAKWWIKECSEDNIKDIEKCCKGCGLSVFLDINDAIKNYKQRPNLGKYIFCVKFNDNFGRIYKTGTGRFPSHISFFVYQDINECEVFKFSYEIDKEGKKNGIK